MVDMLSVKPINLHVVAPSGISLGTVTCLGKSNP